MMIAGPGWIDMQVNGYAGVDFSSADLTFEIFVTACRQLLREGTAAFLPTIITSPTEIYERNLPLIADAIVSPEFQGRLLGIHLEGPFISTEPGAVGAHNPCWTQTPNIRLIERLQKLAGGHIRLLTIAAELPGAANLCRAATALGITVSLGHQLARREHLDQLVAAGARALTHLGNGVPNILPRHDNPIWASLACDSLTAMVIADGHHLSVDMLQVILRAKGLARTIIVSDASPVAGLPHGEYNTLGNRAVLEPDGRLHNPDKGCLVGSSANLAHCMNHLATVMNLRPTELTTVGFQNPLRLLGIDPALIGNKIPR